MRAGETASFHKELLDDWGGKLSDSKSYGRTTKRRCC